jgi:hypothetical protein
LRSCVRPEEPKSKQTNLHPLIDLKKKEFTYKYSLTDSAGASHVVCKYFFCTCLQISQSRVQRAINSAKRNTTAIDRRGASAPGNKTDPNDKLFLKKYIEAFPKYRSHYRREASQKEYLGPGLNLAKMYKLYHEFCEFKSRRPVAEYVFRNVFNTEFNLGFKKPKHDTCKECDEISSSISSAVVPNQMKLKLEKRKEIHMTNVEWTCREFKQDVLNAKNSNDELQCITFDLQKTLEVPSLSTSVAYYKRQLWVYNLCVYDECTRTPYMYIWNESVASRGAQEIASCLIYHIKNHIPEDCKELILWSDSCPGQNKNIKITLMLKKLLNDDLGILNSIQQKYFVSGHS